VSSCAAPAGSPCRTGRDTAAARHRTARFRLVLQLAKALGVPVPPPRGPGPARAGRGRIGCARAPTVRQSPDTQAGSLRAAGITRILAGKISARAVAGVGSFAMPTTLREPLVPTSACRSLKSFSN
jgi:hypothetical protein